MRTKPFFFGEMACFLSALHAVRSMLTVFPPPPRLIAFGVFFFGGWVIFPFSPAIPSHLLLRRLTMRIESGSSPFPLRQAVFSAILFFFPNPPPRRLGVREGASSLSCFLSFSPRAQRVLPAKNGKSQFPPNVEFFSTPSDPPLTGSTRFFSPSPSFSAHITVKLFSYGRFYLWLIRYLPPLLSLQCVFPSSLPSFFFSGRFLSFF